MTQPSPEERWAELLASGDHGAAWDAFLTAHHALLLSTIRRFAFGYDDVMELYAFVCERLAADGCSRLRRFTWGGPARFSTWLVTVVRNLLIDWHRQQHGRKNWDHLVDGRPDLERDIFLEIVRAGRSYVEAHEHLAATAHPGLSFADFLRATRSLHAAVMARGGPAARELLGHGLGTLLEHAPVPPPTASAVDLERALATLEPDDRQAVILFVVHGVSAARVATMVGWADARAVYRRVQRSLKRLRTVLDS